MELFINNKSGAPIYDQIYNQIKQQIISGALQPDEAMPSIRGLARDLRITGKGLFCSPQKHRAAAGREPEKN